VPQWQNLRLRWIRGDTPQQEQKIGALQPDILIMLRTDSKRGNEYSSKFKMEDKTGGA
jgi:hypothetical protein